MTVAASSQIKSLCRFLWPPDSIAKRDALHELACVGIEGMIQGKLFPMQLYFLDLIPTTLREIPQVLRLFILFWTQVCDYKSSFEFTEFIFKRTVSFKI